jgi:hypothetical protein
VSFSAASATAPYTCKDCTRHIVEVRKEFPEFQNWTKSEVDGLTNNMTLSSNAVDTQRAEIKSIVQGGGTALLHRVSSIEVENQRKDCLHIVTISRVPVRFCVSYQNWKPGWSS